MPRYIDADKLDKEVLKYAARKHFHANQIEEATSILKVRQVIHAAPTVDAVEVVRCKECKRRGIVYECPMCYTEDWYDEDEGYDSWDVDKTIDDGFCHCGEKMAAEVTDEQ